MHVIGTNPTTGETKEIEVYAGQRISTYLYNDRNVDSIMFFVEDVTERDLPEFLLERLRENPALLDKVCKETGWDKPWILGIVTPTPTPTPTPTSTEDKSPNTGSDEDMTPPSDEELLPENTEDGVLTKEELAWAHSHIMFTDPGTGIFALKDTTLFDPAFYAATNPDVVAKYGTDPDALLWHYLQRGKKEGRPPIAPPTPTPTPTPWWLYPQEKSEEPEEEPEGEPEATPTPTPAATGGGGQTTSISIGGTYNYDSNSGNSIDITDSNGNVVATLEVMTGQNPLRVARSGQNNDPIEIDLTNNITLHDTAPGGTDTVVNSLYQVDYQGSSVPLVATKTIGSDTYKATREEDPNNPGDVIDTLYKNNQIVTLSNGNQAQSSGPANATDLQNYIYDVQTHGVPNL